MKLQLALVGLSLIAVCGPARAGLGSGPGVGPAPLAEAERLRKKLLAEILAEDTGAPIRPAAPGHSIDRAIEEGGRRSSEESLDGLGTSVASVPTWPVMVLVVFLAGVLLLLRRGGKLTGDRAGVINKLAAVPLGGKRSLALVEVLGQKLVLGLSEKGLSLLTRIEGCEVPPGGGRPAEPFETAGDPFEEELRDLLGDEVEEPAERLDLARKFRHLRGS